MNAKIHLLMFFFFNICAHSLPPAVQETSKTTYGNAVLTRVRQIAPDFTLLCDIRDFPPIVGLNMPVRIRGLESPQTLPDPDLHSFLKQLMTNQNDPNQAVLLKNIERGESFCFIADIYVNGSDLGDHLVREGLVKRILKVPSSDPETNASTADPPSPPPAASQNQPSASKPTLLRPPQPHGFVASKSSKIFHRNDCPHCQRISDDKKVYFSTRDQAIASGRRPCKTCKP